MNHQQHLLHVSKNSKKITTYILPFLVLLISYMGIAVIQEVLDMLRNLEFN